MHLRCTCTAALATADPRAPTEHIGSERAHARGLPAMLQLCSLSMSRPAQIKDQLELNVDSRLKHGQHSAMRACDGRRTVSADQPLPLLLCAGSVGAWNAMLTVWCLAHTSRCSWVHEWAHEHAPCPRRAAAGWDSTAVWRRTDSCALLSRGERV